MAYALAITERIHIGSGIINITPPVCHPARVAEKVAMLDQLAPGRFEFGTGRGSSSVEVLRLRHRLDGHHPRHVRRGAARDREDDGARRVRALRRASSSRCRVARCCRSRSPLPHPPIWVAAGSPGTFEKAARMGIGVLCFSFAGAEALKPLIEIYKNDHRGRRARRRLREQQRHGHHRDDVHGGRRPGARGVPQHPVRLPHVAGREVPRLVSADRRHRQGAHAEAAGPARVREPRHRSARGRGGYARRGDQHDARVRGDRRRPGVVRRAVRRHAVRRRDRVGRDVRQVRAPRVRQGPGVLDHAPARGAAGRTTPGR